MIDIRNESLIPFRQIPAWCKEHLGNRVHPSTVHRWRLRGCRGVKLETILAGGTRCTSAEALQRFFEATTRAQDGQLAGPSLAVSLPEVSTAEAYLESEGF